MFTAVRFSWVHLGAVALLAVASVPAAAAVAQDAPAADATGLAPIRALMEDARFQEGIEAARNYLEQPGVRARDYDACLELLATAQLAVRDNRGATATLATLYGRDPGHRLSDEDPSPVVQAAFARARAATHAPPAVAISPVADYGSSAFTVTVHLDTGASLVDEVRLSYRVQGQAAFVHVGMTLLPDGSVQTRTPRDDDIPGEYNVEYFVEAFAPSMTVLTTAGSAEAPLTLTIPPRPVALSAASTASHAEDGERAPVPHGGSVAGEWWFWTLIGVVVVGLGVGAYFLFGPPSQGLQDGTLGNITLP